MAEWGFRARGQVILLGLLVLCGSWARGQQAPGSVPADTALPDIPALMRAVETNQHTAEALARHYVYHSVQTMRQTDKQGGAKLTSVSEYDVYWIGDVAVRQLVRKDGRELTADERRKEGDRTTKEAEKARARRDRAAAEGKETGPRGEEEVTVSRLLELGRFTNAHRLELDGRPTIQVDFAGDPSAKTRNRFEEVIRDMEGTVWVDEQDSELRRVEGRFVRPFKVGGGLVADIRQGTSFQLDQKKVNNEVWLPSTMGAVGAMRVLLLFHFDGSGSVTNSDYRRFRATSTILPGVGKVEEPSGSTEATGPETKP